MAKKKKRRGRPRVDSEAVTVRMLKSEIAQVDAWMKRHLPKGTRPMAIRWAGGDWPRPRHADRTAQSEGRGEGDSNGAP